MGKDVYVLKHEKVFSALATVKVLNYAKNVCSHLMMSSLSLLLCTLTVHFPPQEAITKERVITVQISTAQTGIC